MIDATPRNQVAFVDTVDSTIEQSRSQKPSRVFRSFTREIPPRAFREWPIAIKRNETAEKVKGRKTEKKEDEARSGSELDEGDDMRSCENERE